MSDTNEADTTRSRPTEPVNGQVMRRAVCPVCGQEASMKWNWTFFGHRQRGECTGDADIQFWIDLHDAGLGLGHPVEPLPYKAEWNRTRYQDLIAGGVSGEAIRVYVALRMHNFRYSLDSDEKWFIATGIPGPVWKRGLHELGEFFRVEDEDHG